MSSSAPSLSALLRAPELAAPRVGVFRPSVEVGDALRGGRSLGELVVLGRRWQLVAPVGVSGEVVAVLGFGPVEYGQPLIEIGERTAGDAAAADSAAADASEGYAVRSPIDGIFYGRPSPDEPLFVQVGATVSDGQTLGLVEVMKTFNPVRFGGPDAPSSGVVLSVRVTDQAEVGAGDVLFVIGSETGA